MVHCFSLFNQIISSPTRSRNGPKARDCFHGPYVEKECFRRIHHTGLESIAELSHLHNYNVSIQIVLFAVNINYAANRRELLSLRAMKKPSCRVFTTIVVAFAIVLFSSKSQPKQIVSRADQTGQLAFSPTSGAGD
jgi:hypothetical protein